ncbi:uncharacterized protein BP5553_04577 [Venustampulla echinocandica]|uniref:P-loop containing nucleoside triphosphate hydrolase n=1 Tax=Venustampulla echinocandica TaxID=2656787 RepID=A0A370TNQ6_9HELO|nr:uncharacterized protein BP5553_04577 [Venustampulla echinocandica]RDL37144.1 hypothetical protein BP5553_04577 [Venustampulla echinocandica]
MDSDMGMRLKRQPTIGLGGLPTPSQSMTTAGTVTPKQEEVEEVGLLPDSLQDNNFHGPSFGFQNGLPTADSSFFSNTSEQYRRSEGVSLRSSRAPPPPRTDTMATTTSEQTGLEAVGKHVKRLIDMMEELRRIGLKDIDTHLPELVLVGDQSAGKSSLMSAIAEINLPKGDSMCTRCPTNIKTSDAATWSCEVSLHESYNYDPVKRPRAKFPHWAEREEGMLVRSFKAIQEKSELEEVLRWAQIALRNPNADYASFIPGTTGHSRHSYERTSNPDFTEQVGFSPNVIAVEICGPGLPELSFYDLPGLFNNAEEKSQEYLINVFENLTMKYIKHERALIICAMAMQNDAGMSRTKAVISRCKAEDRCIGVLTMPDRVHAENKHIDYDNILRGKKYVLPRGYFVTKQPGPSSRCLKGPDYHEQARREEEDFFNTDRLWRDGGEWSQFRSRCGTSPIQKYLSIEFGKLISSSIPDIEHEIRARTAKVDEELSLLPKLDTEKVQHTVRQRLIKFSSEIRTLLDGNGTSAAYSTTFHSDWKRLCYQFQKATEVMRPGCQCNHPSDKVSEVITIDDDSDGGSRSPVSFRTPVPSSKRPAQYVESPSAKRQRINTTPTPIKHEGVPKGSGPVRTPAINGQNGGFSVAFKKLKMEDFGPFYQRYLDSGRGAMSLADLRESIENHGRPGVPDEISHRVKEHYALVSIIPWEYPLKTFLDSTFAMLRAEFHRVLSGVLDHYLDTDLYRRSKVIVDDFLTYHEEVLRERSLKMYAIEKSTLFTINDRAFILNKAEALENLRAIRRRVRVDAYIDGSTRLANSRLDKEDLRNKVTNEQLGPDKFERELDVAAYIRGYYTTARLRFTDLICANINAALFDEIKEGADYLLERRLTIDIGNGEAKCQQLLEGNAEMARRRGRLMNEKEQLAKFTHTLEDFHNDPIFEDATDSQPSDALRPGHYSPSCMTEVGDE